MKIEEVLQSLSVVYPSELVNEQIRDIPRIRFHVELCAASAHPKQLGELEICDLGGGIGLFSAGCAATGMRRVVLVDDFDDEVNRVHGGSVLDIHRRQGVEVHSLDVIEEGIERVQGKFDIITAFDTMEHWHHSPKRLFSQILEKLKPGGTFVLGVPNCVNLRKRISTPLGIGRWSSMQDWYDSERFRGHVREPNVSDLRYIARDMGLTDVSVLGRNWMGSTAQSALKRRLAKIVDHPLRLRPSLCANIYLVGRRPPEA